MTSQFETVSKPSKNYNNTINKQFWTNKTKREQINQKTMKTIKQQLETINCFILLAIGFVVGVWSCFLLMFFWWGLFMGSNDFFSCLMVSWKTIMRIVRSILRITTTTSTTSALNKNSNMPWSPLLRLAVQSIVGCTSRSTVR